MATKIVYKSSVDAIVIRQVTTNKDFESLIQPLSQLLQSCVNKDPESSSIGFRAPLSDSAAAAYWQSTSPRLFEHKPGLFFFVLERTSASDSCILGTVQVATNPKETHMHKAEIIKLLLLPEQRGKGSGKLLLSIAERFALEELGKTMTVLDTATETPAREFYLKMGYKEWGICPNYSMSATGKLQECSFFCKFLGPLE